jgi:hypothetical protein
MQVLQLDMQKRRKVQHSVMNDVNLKEFVALAISELYVFGKDGKVSTSPMGHQGWTAILPSERHDGRWAVRSMLWVRKDIKCEHVIVPSADLTVALLRLPGRSMLLASVYVEGGNTAALSGTMRLLDDAISTAQRRGGPRLMLWSPATSIGMTSCGEETGSCRHDRVSLEPVYTRARCREPKDVSGPELGESGDAFETSWKSQTARPLPKIR